MTKSSQFPLSQDEINQMLQALGKGSLEDLFSHLKELTIGDRKIPFPPALSDVAVMEELKRKARQNKTVEDYHSFLGGGAYHHFIPPAVDFLVSRGEFFTAYTPYQAEASQGTLQAIFEFQTMITRITGMDVANASMYDGATALAEAAIVAVRHTNIKRVALSRGVNPRYREVVRTYMEPLGIEIIELAHQKGVTDFSILESTSFYPVAAVIVQEPNYFGVIEDYTGVAETLHQQKALLIISCNPASLGIVKSPGEWGSDMACGEGQPLGIPLSFGGPYFGFFAVRKDLMRLLPGRVVGKSKDKTGQTAYVLTLQTREQHIRREKATSNICTNEALCALRATIFLALYGEQGFRQWGLHNHQQAGKLRKALSEIKGVTFINEAPFFNEFAFTTTLPAEELLGRLKKAGILGGLSLAGDYPELNNGILTCATEMASDFSIAAYQKALKEIV